MVFPLAFIACRAHSLTVLSVAIWAAAAVALDPVFRVGTGCVVLTVSVGSRSLIQCFVTHRLVRVICVIFSCSLARVPF